jgi:hypothetical protein
MRVRDSAVSSPGATVALHLLLFSPLAVETCKISYVAFTFFFLRFEGAIFGARADRFLDVVYDQVQR